MRCKVCGKRIKEKANYCPECGWPLETGAEFEVQSLNNEKKIIIGGVIAVMAALLVIMMYRVSIPKGEEAVSIAPEPEGIETVQQTEAETEWAVHTPLEDVIFTRNLVDILNQPYSVPQFEEAFGYANDCQETAMYDAEYFLVYTECTYKEVIGTMKIYISEEDKITACRFEAPAETVDDKIVENEINSIKDVWTTTSMHTPSVDKGFQISFTGSAQGAGTICLDLEKNEYLVLIYSLENTQTGK